MSKCYVAFDEGETVIGVGKTPVEAARSFADRYAVIYGGPAGDASVSVPVGVIEASGRECVEARAIVRLYDDLWAMAKASPGAAGVQ